MKLLIQAMAIDKKLCDASNQCLDEGAKSQQSGKEGVECVRVTIYIMMFRSKSGGNLQVDESRW